VTAELPPGAAPASETRPGWQLSRHSSGVTSVNVESGWSTSTM